MKREIFFSYERYLCKKTLLARNAYLFQSCVDNKKTICASVLQKYTFYLAGKKYFCKISPNRNMSLGGYPLIFNRTSTAVI